MAESTHNIQCKEVYEERLLQLRSPNVGPQIMVNLGGGGLKVRATHRVQFAIVVLWQKAMQLKSVCSKKKFERWWARGTRGKNTCSSAQVINLIIYKRKYRKGEIWFK